MRHPRLAFLSTSLRACAAFSLFLMLLPSASDAAGTQPWVDTRQVGPLVCQATFPLKEYEPLLGELKELQRELTRTLGVQPGREPIYVYLFSDERTHQAYIEQHYPGVPYRRALFIKEGGLAGVYAYRHDDLAVDLRHECTHAFLHASLPMVPLWLDEGLAKYFEVPTADRAFDHPYFDSLRWNMRLGMIRTVDQLEQRTDVADMGALEYRYSWAWVHFMLHGPESAHGTLVQYLDDIGHGAPAGHLSERLDQSTPDATERMIQHFKHWHRSSPPANSHDVDLAGRAGRVDQR